MGFDNLDFAEKVTALFLKKKANPNLFGEVDRLTPLHIACIWGREKIVKMLLEHGGDLELKSAENETPISVAIRENNYAVIEVIQKFVFEQKIDRKKKDLILRASDQIVPEELLTTPVKNNHLRKALQSLDEKSFTPNRINYNFDVTSPYYVNITHRRHKTSRENSKLYDDDYAEDEQKNLFELTEKNLGEFSKQMSQVVVIDRFAIHKRQSYIRKWREQIQQIKKADGIDVSYINYLNMCNDVTLMEAAKGPATIEGGYRSDNISEVVEIKSSNDSFVTAQSDLDRRGHAIQAPRILELVQENYIHSDEENGVVFFEKKIISKSRGNLKELDDSDLDKTQSSASTRLTLPPLDYDTDVLRAELKELTGVAPVINRNTKKLYLKQLVKKRLDLGSPEQRLQRSEWPCFLKLFSVLIFFPSTEYPQELQRTIDKFTFLEKNLEEFLKLESQMSKHFIERPLIKWREGNLKTSFIYLLIDPRITENLTLRYKEMDKEDVWSVFLSSIFYVGKGKQSRPYSHLYDAIKLFAQENHQLANRLENKNQVIERRVIYSNAATANNPTQGARKNAPEKPNPNRAQDSKKLNKIVDIWKAESGVVCLHIFNNIMPADAFTREAAIIEALGLHNLTNLKQGDYYGCARNFSRRQKARLGIGLLHRAMNIYLAEGESQLLPYDLI